MSVSRDDREDLTMAMITNDWLTALDGEFHKPIAIMNWLYMATSLEKHFWIISSYSIM